MFYCKYASPIGMLTITGSMDTITGLWIDGQKHFDPAWLDQGVNGCTVPSLTAAKTWLDRYFSGEAPHPDMLQVQVCGSRFQMAVWEQLRRIPYGQTVTYGQLACLVAAELKVTAMSAQAVGGAVGRNPVSIIIPCHRVVGANHRITGYAGGIDKKLWLLSHEGIDTNPFRI